MGQSFRRSSGRSFRSIALWGALAVLMAASAVFVQGAAPPAGQAQAGMTELLFAQAKRLFDTFKYDECEQQLNSIITALTAGGQVQKPDLLVQAYELRARSRFNQGNQPGTEQDFSALLLVKPGFALVGGSPRLVPVFEGVKKLTVGTIMVSLTPAGEITIDKTTYTAEATPSALALPGGEHQVTAARQGYKSIDERFTVAAGATAPLALVLERTSATLAVISIPEGVEVLLDGTSKGTTVKGAGGVESAPLIISELQPGAHRLQLKRDCYKTLESTITIDKPDDLKTDPLRLTQATATVKVTAADAASSIFVDGASRGQAPADLTICEGTHLIEVKSPKGRFVDRREWKTGDSTTLSAELRSAFPIVATKGASGPTLDQLRVSVERALSSAKHILVYVPADSDVEAASRGENIPVDWLSPDPVDGVAGPRIPKEVKREIGRKLASKLQTQGVAAVTAGQDPYTVFVAILGAGSGEPDVLTINMADPASQAKAVQTIGASLPPLAKPSIETAVVDLMGVQGAAVVRASGVGAKAGLAVGDVIVGSLNVPIASVADLRAKIAGIKPPTAEISLDVKGPTGVARKVSVPVTMAADAIGLRDTSLLYNRALIDLTDMVTATATSPVERTAARINLAIVQMRLGNLDDALTSLRDVQLPDGPGVSGGTVSYLTGLCFKALGRTPEAQAAFTKAAASPQARLSAEGALVAPLAKQELRR
jgi:hypothetical protein